MHAGAVALFVVQDRAAAAEALRFSVLDRGKAHRVAVFEGAAVAA